MRQNPKNKENNNDIPFNVLFPHHQINANSIIYFLLKKLVRFDPRLYCKVTVWKFVSFFVGRRYLLHLFCIKHLGFVTSVHPLFCLCLLLVVLNRIVESSLKGNKQQWDIKQNTAVIESLKPDRNTNTMTS